MSAREQILDLKQRITASVIGPETVVDFLLIALLANGHVLLEGLPGLAKTRTIKTLAARLEPLRCIESRMTSVRWVSSMILWLRHGILVVRISPDHPFFAGAEYGQ